MDATGVGFNGGGDTRGCRARTTSNTGGARVLGSRVVGIEPEHVYCVVIPDRENENHSSLERVTHSDKTTLLGEGVGITESGLLRSAEVVGDRVTGDTRDLGLRVGDDHVVLDVETLDLVEVSGVGTIISEELGNNRERLGGVDSLTRSVEGEVAHTVGVEIASSLITGSRAVDTRSTALCLFID